MGDAVVWVAEVTRGRTNQPQRYTLTAPTANAALRRVHETAHPTSHDTIHLYRADRPSPPATAPDAPVLPPGPPGRKRRPPDASLPYITHRP